MYDVNLQPITPESKIPFKKVLLLSNGEMAVTGILKSIDENGYSLTMALGYIGLDGTVKPVTRLIFKPTHYAILNISIEK